MSHKTWWLPTTIRFPPIYTVSSSCYCCFGRRGESCSYIFYKGHPPTSLQPMSQKSWWLPITPKFPHLYCVSSWNFCIGKRSESCSYIGYKVHPPSPL